MISYSRAILVDEIFDLKPVKRLAFAVGDDPINCQKRLLAISCICFPHQPRNALAVTGDDNFLTALHHVEQGI